MTFVKKSVAGLGMGLLAAGMGNAQTNSAELVDALNGVFGKHAQARASHAKGVCVMGHFSPDASQKLVSGPFWQQKQVPVQARFSVGGGNPKATDKGKTVRGLALHIGNGWDLVLLSAPVFMVATPEEFVGFMAARRPDPVSGKPDPVRVRAFNEATPSTKAQIAFLEKTPVPASYAQTPYWGVNAFTFTGAQNKTVHGRWRAEPQAGRAGLSAEDLAKLDDNFLVPELEKRLGTGVVRFDLWVQLAKDTDNVLDPSIAWGDENPQVRVGEIVITGLDNTCERTMFNPVILPDGVGLSKDPTLQVRAGAYAVSLGRRAEPNAK